MEHPSHPVESHWRTSLRNRIIQASSLLEVLLSGLVLIGLLLSVVPLIRWMPGLLFDGNEAEIRTFLERSLDIVIGIEFIKMLAKHSPGSSLEVLLYAIARHLVVGHDSAVENLLSVGAIALIFIVRKFFFVPAFGAHLPDGHPAPDLTPAQSGIPAAVLAGYLSEQTHLLGMLSPQRSSTWSLYTGSVNGPLNRLEFVTMLYEMAGKPKPGASAAFIDVSNSDAAVWAAETGVVSGNGTGKFLPTQTVTREQAAVMLYNYAKFLGLKTPSSGPSATALLDCGEIAVWARPAVEFCIRTGALPAAGLRGDLFLPRGTLTRGEANRCLAAFADYIEAN